MSILDTVFKATQFKDLPMGKVFGQLAIHTSDPANDQIYVAEKFVSANVKSLVYDGNSNTFSSFWPTFYDHKIHRGRDGYFYRPDFANMKVTRRTASGAIVPFSVTGDSSSLVDTGEVFRYGERDNLFVTKSGDIYNLYYHKDRAGDSVKMVVHDKDGTVKRRDVLYNFNGARTVSVDTRGNIYVSDNLKPVNSPLPSYVEQLSFLDENPLPFTLEGSFRKIMMASYGSVLKFGPDGGKCRILGAAEQPKTGETEMVSYSSLNGTARYAVSGLLGYYRGISLLPPTKNYRTGIAVCDCFGATYDMDLYDRLAVPDAIQHKIHILDANMNVIHSFGGYDNFDNKGGALAGTRPAIPLELPMQAAMTDKAIYATSYGSRTHAEYTLAGTRIIRAALVYDKEYLSGQVTISEKNNGNKNRMQLSGSPNPFNPTTNLYVNVSSAGSVGQISLAIYDTKGRLVKKLLSMHVNESSFKQSIVWNGLNENGAAVATGTYVCKLNSLGKSQITKLVLTR